MVWSCFVGSVRGGLGLMQGVGPDGGAGLKWAEPFGGLLCHYVNGRGLEGGGA